MGLAASQCRLLALTGRLSDLELSAQKKSNEKQRLSVQSEEIAADYTKALDKKTIKFTPSGSTNNVNLTARVLSQCGKDGNTDLQRLLVDSTGRILVSKETSDAFKSANGDITSFLTALGVSDTDNTNKTYYTRLFNELTGANGMITESDSNLASSDWLNTQLTNGNLYLEEFKMNSAGTGGTFQGIDWASGDNQIVQVDDDTELAKAKAHYDSNMTKINAKDQQLDLDMKNIDTEHNAVQTEIDSVSKVISKNIERSFKIFNS
jgi:ribosomal protein L9